MVVQNPQMKLLMKSQVTSWANFLQILTLKQQWEDIQPLILKAWILCLSKRWDALTNCCRQYGTRVWTSRKQSRWAEENLSRQIPTLQIYGSDPEVWYRSVSQTLARIWIPHWFIDLYLKTDRGAMEYKSTVVPAAEKPNQKVYYRFASK